MKNRLKQPCFITQIDAACRTIHIDTGEVGARSMLVFVVNTEGTLFVLS
ncbi:MAG: hypothetical protein P4N59_08885 [Negativicutes bacterium]|nr:hypothetical protein [Negativicutes bacterium]